MKHLARLALLLALFLPARSGIHTLATITGSNTTVALSTGAEVASWIQIIAPSGNASAVRFGDSLTSATRGLPIAAGGGYNTPSCQTCQYPLSGTYIYVATGDTASVAWGN